jgi:uncharacterized membrane-anchored protein
MKSSVLIVTTLLVLGTLNWLIIGKELILRSGRTVLCELAPRDPRSIMQGDYMVLRYAIALDAASHVPKGTSDGNLILTLDEHDVATFQRVDNDTPLASTEVRVRFRSRTGFFGGGSIQIGAESYFFQEGRAEHFNEARYGELKVASSGECILVGLRNAERKPL